jgi:hypothetical protein
MNSINFVKIRSASAIILIYPYQKIHEPPNNNLLLGDVRDEAEEIIKHRANDKK